MNGFGFMSAAITVFYKTGEDAFGDPIIESSTFRNVSNNATAEQIQEVAAALVGLTDNLYVETVKTTKVLVAD